MKNTVLSLVLVSSTLGSWQAYAGASANVGVTSNYVWRGVTQTDKALALQAGLDYATDNGLYVGTWVSNSKFVDTDGNALEGPEVDLYAGYKKDLKGDLGVDAGVTKYFYPDDNSIEFTEVYVKPSYKSFNAEVSYTLDSNNDVGAGQQGDIYYGLGYSGELSNGFGYGVKAGYTDYKDDAAADYTHYQLSLTKGFDTFGDVTLAVDDSDLANTDPMPSVAWKKTFEF